MSCVFGYFHRKMQGIFCNDDFAPVRWPSSCIAEARAAGLFMFRPYLGGSWTWPAYIEYDQHFVALWCVSWCIVHLCCRTVMCMHIWIIPSGAYLTLTLIIWNNPTGHDLGYDHDKPGPLWMNGWKTHEAGGQPGQSQYKTIKHCTVGFNRCH